MADSVESMIGALFLSTDNLRYVFKWIDQIKLVPLSPLNLVDCFEDFSECTFSNLKKVDLLSLPFDKSEKLQDLFEKYFSMPESDCDALTSERLKNLIYNKEAIGDFGQKINPISHLHG